MTSSLYPWQWWLLFPLHVQPFLCNLLFLGFSFYFFCLSPISSTLLVCAPQYAIDVDSHLAATLMEHNIVVGIIIALCTIVWKVRPHTQRHNISLACPMIPLPSVGRYVSFALLRILIFPPRSPTDIAHVCLTSFVSRPSFASLVFESLER